MAETQSPAVPASKPKDPCAERVGKGVVLTTLFLVGLGIVVCAFKPAAKRAVAIGILVSPIPPIP
jgi:hypothetical protein